MPSRDTDIVDKFLTGISKPLTWCEWSR